MKHPVPRRRAAAPDLPGFARVLPEIQSLIEAARQHVVSTANLTLVWLYWNVGRVITQDILTVDLAKHHHLGWTHYRILLSVEAGLKRGFYFQQAATHRWSKRELQRQIDRALFERVALSNDTRALVRLETESGPVETVRYEDAFKDPYLLDFLGLKGAYSERDLEADIIASLQQFLTELGSDFCFIRSPLPMRIEDDWSPYPQESLRMRL